MLRIYFFLPLALLLGGCIHSANLAPNSDFHSVDFSNASKWKRGESCDLNLLGVINVERDDRMTNSVVHAAIKAGIKHVYIVENKYVWLLLFDKRCTIVYGE